MSQYEEFLSHIEDISSPSSESIKGDIQDIKTPDSEEPSEEIEPPPKIKKIDRSAKLIQECRSVDAYTIKSKIEEGSYGIVFKAVEKETSTF